MANQLFLFQPMISSNGSTAHNWRRWAKTAVQGKEEGSQQKTQQSLRAQVVFNPSSLIGTIISLGGRPRHPPLDGRRPSDAGRVSHRLSISHTWEAVECLTWSCLLDIRAFSWLCSCCMGVLAVLLPTISWASNRCPRLGEVLSKCTLNERRGAT